MNKYIFLFLYFTTQLNALHNPQGYYEFETTRKDWAFSTTFELDSHARTYGTVEKNTFHVRTNYDLYDDLGDYKAKAIIRFFCLGLFWTWATEIDVYDENNKYVGFIDGEIFTTEAAKFAFYDSDGQHVATAYLDDEGSSFSIVPAINEHLTIADINLMPTEHLPASWKTEVHIPFEIDIRLILIFSTFVVDRQNAFF